MNSIELPPLDSFKSVGCVSGRSGFVEDGGDCGVRASGCFTDRTGKLALRDWAAIAAATVAKLASSEVGAVGAGVDEYGAPRCDWEASRPMGGFLKAS